MISQRDKCIRMQSKVVLLMLVFVAMIICPVFAETGETVFDKAAEYFDNAQYEEAISLWNQSMQLDSSLSANAYYNTGLAYAGMKDYNNAIIAWKKTIDLVPDSGMAHNNLGTAYAFLGQNELAESEYLLATELEPDNTKFSADLSIFRKLLYEKTESPLSPIVIIFAITSVSLLMVYIRKRE